MKYKIGDIIRRNDIPMDDQTNIEIRRVVITGWEDGHYVFGDGEVKHPFSRIDRAKWLYKAGNILKETLARL